MVRNIEVWYKHVYVSVRVIACLPKISSCVTGAMATGESSGVLKMQGLIHAFFSISFIACDIDESARQLVSYLHRLIHNYSSTKAQNKIMCQSLRRSIGYILTVADRHSLLYKGILGQNKRMGVVPRTCGLLECKSTLIMIMEQIGLHDMAQ